MAVLFSSSDAGHDKRPVQGNGTASCASFRRFQPSRQAIETKAASIPGNHSARQRQMPPSRDQSSKRNDAILTSDHSVPENRRTPPPPQPAPERSEPSPIRFWGVGIRRERLEGAVRREGARGGGEDDERICDDGGTELAVP
jgi:hypothetical protein